MALKGITFDKQSFSAMNDGGFYQRILPTDGALWGCSLSNTVNTITINPGLLICAGRFLEFDGATTYTLPSANSTSTGYMRLVLTLDLSKTNTESAFNQGEVVWEYSATTTFAPFNNPDNFNDATKSGQKYKMQLCVYPITSGNLGNLRTPMARAATPDLPLSGGTMTGTLTTTAPKINKNLLLLGDGTRKLSLRWSESGAGDSVYIYITPNGGSEQQIVNISAANKYITMLRLKGAEALTFADGLPIKNATVAGDLTMQFQYIFRIPGAIVIQMSIYHPSGDGIPDGGLICTIPSGYRPSKTFTSTARLQKSAGGIVPNGYVQIKSNGQVTASKNCRYVEFTAIIPSTF